jgi:hypothetical protein
MSDSLEFPREEKENISNITEEIKEILDVLPSFQRSKDMENQNKALDMISPDLVMELRGHIYNVIRTEEQREQDSIKNQMDIYKDNPEKFIKGHLKGEVFERLVDLDPQVKKHRYQFYSEDSEKITELDNLSREILNVMQNPERYGLGDKIDLKRLPDATYLGLSDAGKIVIFEVGEAKSGIIDERFVSQTSYFEESVEIIAKELSKLRHSKRLRNLGLESMASRMEISGMEGKSNFVTVSKDLKNTLIIPQNKIIEGKWVEDCVDEIIRSSFTTYEIEAITEFLFEKIRDVDSSF